MNDINKENKNDRLIIGLTYTEEEGLDKTIYIRSNKIPDGYFEDAILELKHKDNMVLEQLADILNHKFCSKIMKEKLESGELEVINNIAVYKGTNERFPNREARYEKMFTNERLNKMDLSKHSYWRSDN